MKSLEDGRAMLNLACGSRMHPDWNNLDFSPLTLLVKHMVLARIMRKVGILSENRFERLLEIAPNINRWDLRKGIPFEEGVLDVVYHSHFLEHLDREVADAFLKECYRVLKPSGIMRVVVPDLEVRCRKYLVTLQALTQAKNPDPGAMVAHQETIRRLLGQMIVTKLAGTAEQVLLMRVGERFIRGDTARAGEIHRWMYDQYTLKELLRNVGFKDIRFESPSTGRIQDWSAFCLDTHEDGSAYKRESIYVEVVK